MFMNGIMKKREKFFMSAKDMEIDDVKNQKQKEIVSFIIIPKNINAIIELFMIV